MQFEASTQAKSWMFSSESLLACKRKALSSKSNYATKQTTYVTGQVRKFASGFHKRGDCQIYANSKSFDLSLHDQELMIQFHAHQIQFLVGPNAILYDLRTSERVLSTAIMFFRRFYLSNSVIDISPRQIAAACSFFAAKVEEEKVEVRKMVS